MFYTKYRPQKFSEIVSTSNAPRAISKQVATGKTVHAYLFTGPRGIGKTTTARVLAKALNCENLDKNGDPCGECVACDAIQSGSFMDLIEIDAASNRGIDDIRDLKSKVGLAPAHGKNKVYIIDEVHMLTKEAFNALLKTLEEPPQNVTFILCTTEENKVPETIKSRCQTYKFKRASTLQIVDNLKTIAKAENYEISDEDLEKIASASLGGFRDAITLLQQVIEGDINVDSFSGLGGAKGYHTFIEYLNDKDVSSALGIIREVFDDGADLYIWTGELLRYLRDLLLIKSQAESLASVVTEELKTKMNAQAESIDISWLIFVMDEFIDAQNEIRDSFIPQISLELAVVKICENYSSKEATTGSVNPKKPESTGSDKDEKLRVENLSKGTSKSESPKSEKAVKTKSSSNEIICIEEVEKSWEVFLDEVKKVNHSLLALIKHSTPLHVEGNTVVLEVAYTFHKERLETPRNRKLIEQALESSYQRNITIRCEISEERAKELNSGSAKALTDYNIFVPQEPVTVDKETLIESFDGGLPLV